MLYHHGTGDWGDWPEALVDEATLTGMFQENDHAVEHGGEITSCFPVERDPFDLEDTSEEFIAVDTTSDRSYTALMTLAEHLAEVE